MSSWPCVFVFSLLMFLPLLRVLPRKSLWLFFGLGGGLPHFVEGVTQNFFVHIRVYAGEQPLVGQMNPSICKLYLGCYECV